MLSSEEMLALKEDETYRATRGWKYNWKYVKRALILGFKDLPSRSLQHENPASDSPQEYDRCYATGFQKTFWGISKRLIIAREIGEFRNDVIENAYCSGVRKLNFEQIISRNCIWMEIDAKKLAFFRNMTILFLADIQVSAAFYHYTHIPKKEEEYKRIEKEIEERFSDYIKSAKHTAFLKSSTPSKDRDESAIIAAVTAAFTEVVQYE